MQSFVEHYLNEEQQLDEFTWGQLGKGFLRLGKNIFGKRTVGVGINLMTSLKSVDRSTYNFVQATLSKSFQNSKKEKKPSKIYIKDVYKGEIDDSAKRLGGYENIKDQIEDVSVFQTNKGGRITTIFLLDENDNEKYYIGTNWRGDRQFKDIFGYYPTALTSKLNTMRKKNIPVNKIIEDPKTYLLDEPEEIKEPEETEKEPEDVLGKISADSEKEFGVMDISRDEMDSLVKILGDGRRGGTVKGMRYPFRGKFERDPYKHPNTGFRGYKYSDGTHEVYILDVGNDTNAMIVFADRESFDWAKTLGMLSSWRTSNIKSDITWEQGTIEDLPE